MSNLGPQKINLSYDGLLQVPGGLTASLQTITDGNGNSSGLQLSTSGFSGQITSDGVVITGGTINGTTIGASTPATGRFTSLTATGTTTLNTSLTGLLKGTSGVVGLAAAGTDYVSPSVLGQANGVATLGADSKLTASQVPAIAVTEYLGAVNSQAAMLALTGQAGDWCTRTDLGTNWIITGSNPALLADWTELSYPTAPVISVNGLTGAVSLSYTNVGAAPATTGSSILYANGSGGFSNVTVGSGLTFVGGTLAAASASGTVTSVSVVSANGLAGTVANPSTTPAITLSTSVTGVLKGNGTAISAAVSGTDYAPATSGTSILKGDNAGGFAAAVANTDYQSVITATGLLKGAGAGSISAAVVGTDYAPATTGTAILKGNGTGGFSSAVSGTDYAPATSGTSLLKGNGSGGFSNATSGTDYAPATSGTDILYGNGSGGFSNVTVGSGLSFTGGTLASTAGGGSVTTVSVVSANGFAGTVANASSTPAITLTTSVTGLLKGNGTAISAATSGTDYAPATSGTAILKGNGSGGFNSAAAGTDYAVPTSGTSILYGNGSGGFSNVTVGSNLTFTGGTLAASSTMVYPSAGMAVSTGSAWGTSKTAPTGDVVGTSDTQTLTNKTLTAAGSNTVEATSGPTSTQLAGNRNKIINGACAIFQRGTNLSTNNTQGYYVDRWWGFSGVSTAATYSQVSSTGLANYPYAIRAQRNSGNTGTNGVYTGQIVESNNLQDLQGQSVTISFWARAGANFSGPSGALTVWLRTGTTADQGLNTLISPGWAGAVDQTTNVTLTTSWQKFTVTTFTVASNVQEITAFFSFAGAGTAGANDYYDITGLQLERGDTATPFENRLYGTELALCQWYYQILGYLYGYALTSEVIQGTVTGLSMRAAPTATMLTSTPYAESPINVTARTGSGSTTAGSPSINQYGSQMIRVTGFSGMTAGTISSVTDHQIALNAEL